MRRTIFLSSVVSASFLSLLCSFALADQSKNNLDAAETLLVEKLIRSVQLGDKDAYASIFDLQAFADRVVASAGHEGEARRGAIHGFNKVGRAKILDAFVDRMQKFNGHVLFLRAVMRDGEKRLIVRVDHDNGHVYKEYVVAKTSGGLRIVDIYELNVGQLQSQTLGGMTRLLRDPDKNLIKRMLGISRVDNSTSDAFIAVGNLIAAGKNAEAVVAFRNLPSEIRTNKIILLAQIAVATASGNQEAVQDLESELSLRYPDDPAIGLYFVDRYLEGGDIRKTTRVIDALEKEVGRDGLTLYYRSAVQCNAGAYEQCIAMAKEAIKVEPDFESAYYELALGYAGLQKYSLASAALKTWAEKFQLELTGEWIMQQAEFADFVKSPAFNEWLPK